MATIYDRNGYTIAEGLRGCTECDEAIKAAYRQSATRNEPVILEDDDGTWLVPIIGPATEMQSF